MMPNATQNIVYVPHTEEVTVIQQNIFGGVFIPIKLDQNNIRHVKKIFFSQKKIKQIILNNSYWLEMCSPIFFFKKLLSHKKIDQK